MLDKYEVMKKVDELHRQSEVHHNDTNLSSVGEVNSSDVAEKSPKSHEITESINAGQVSDELSSSESDEDEMDVLSLRDLLTLSIESSDGDVDKTLEDIRKELAEVQCFRAGIKRSGVDHHVSSDQAREHLESYIPPTKEKVRLSEENRILQDHIEQLKGEIAVRKGYAKSIFAFFLPTDTSLKEKKVNELIALQAQLGKIGWNQAIKSAKNSEVLKECAIIPRFGGFFHVSRSEDAINRIIALEAEAKTEKTF